MIYFWEKEREQYIEDLNFLANQLKLRLFDSFRDIESEASAEREKYLLEYGALFGEDGDPGEAYEGAYDRYIDYQLHIFELMRELYLTALSGLYFMWDRQLKEFFERELRYYLHEESFEKDIWGKSPGELLRNMRNLGLVFDEFHDMRQIRKMHLIVNVHKHGKRRSLRLLRKEFGEEFSYIWGNPIEVENLDEKSLFVSEDDFFKYAEVLRNFWKNFPKNLSSPET